MPKRIQFHLDENVDPDNVFLPLRLCSFAPLRETKTVFIYLKIAIKRCVS
ncbi:MAG: hypothetical protein PX483_20465 [Nostocales cyanobacterium LE14-WE4]|nr:hypothetical protein [Anabaena sp. 49633_E8]MCE2699893.1 hypothetical protein [Anabaena sp. 49633_E8]MDJ0503176.1 hypothetical protein [Nostocales cyanobacterium LE14-WE4]